MTFLNAFLALGAAAFTIPLVIHLLNRSKYLTIDWGAMQFLSSALQVNSRRMQWKQWLLLLIRCMIPVLLALAMSRPILQAWRDSGVGSAMSMAIVLDDSLSMQRRDASGSDAGDASVAVRRFERAVTAARGLLQQLPAGSSAALILGGSPSQMLPEHQPTRLIERLDALKESLSYSGRLDLEQSVDTSVDWLNGSQHPRRQLVVISDFQASQWEASERDAVRELARRIEAQPVKIEWNWLPILGGDAVQEVQDVAVVSLDCVPTLVSPFTDLQVTGTLWNSSKSAVQVPVVLSQGLEELERQSVQIGPEATSVVRFAWKPKSSGDIELRLTLDFDDACVADHHLSTVLRVREPQKVLFIDGDRRNEAMKSESDFFRLALTPFSLLRGESGDLFAARVVDIGGWKEEDLREFQAVVCCNVRDLNGDQRRWLRAFVEQGNGLVVCLGDQVQIAQTNSWESIQQQGLRPGILSARSEWTGRLGTTATPFFPLSKASMDSLLSTQFEHRYEMEIDDEQTNIGMAFSDGKPWLISTPIGKGRCVWMLSSCDDADSNLISRPAFVPMVQKLMAYAIQLETSNRVLRPGDAWRESWVVDEEGPQRTMSLVHPDQSTEEVTLEPSLESVGAESDGARRFLAQMTASRSLGVARASVGKDQRMVSIENSTQDRRRELQMASLSKETVETLAESASAVPVTDADDWVRKAGSSWGGRELWTSFWWGLLVLFLAEMALQQAMLPRSPRGAVTGPNDHATPRVPNRGAA
jgi:hypothetical protein